VAQVSLHQRCGGGWRADAVRVAEAAGGKPASSSGHRASPSSRASDLHALLSEVFDASSIPSPDLNRNPNAAVALAQIAISGRVPGDMATPQAAGFIWLWPLVIVVGGIAFVLASKIRNDAETAQEREHYQCIRDGHCTDSGFWLKVGAVGFLGWLAWDRLGVGDRVKGLIKKR
jgi:hypothetical protein